MRDPAGSGASDVAGPGSGAALARRRRPTTIGTRERPPVRGMGPVDSDVDKGWAWAVDGWVRAWADAQSTAEGVVSAARGGSWLSLANRWGVRCPGSVSPRHASRSWKGRVPVLRWRDGNSAGIHSAGSGLPCKDAICGSSRSMVRSMVIARGDILLMAAFWCSVADVNIVG